MKKFSTITNQTVGQEPKVEKIYGETDIFRFKILKLMEDFLSIQTYGPVDRYLREGSIKIKGQELFTEALLSLLDEKTIKEQTKLLEGLKSELRDWETIDSKIEDINTKSDNFKTIYKVNQLLEKYGDDEEMLIQVVEEQSKRVLDVELLQSYKSTFSSSKLAPATLEAISDIYSQRISENFMDKLNTYIDKGSALYPKLAKIVGGDNSFWYTIKEGDQWLTFELRYGDEGVSYPLAKFSDLDDENFKPEDISPSYIIKMCFE